MPEKPTADEKIQANKDANRVRKAKHDDETKPDKFRRYFVGPFQFLAFSLIMSEGLLACWMYTLSDLTISTNHYERIVVGSLSIAVLIAVLVVFSVVYNIKNSHGDCKH